jgi:hypothetical protein
MLRSSSPRRAGRVISFRRIVLVGASVAALALSCDRPPPPAEPTTTPSPGRFRPPVFTHGQLTTLAILAPDRPTHLAVLPSGKPFFCQPTDDGRDLVLTIGPREVPAPTALTSSTIADALDDPLITGNIVSLAAGPDHRLWFFFRGGIGEGRQRRTVLAVGNYDVFTTRVRIFADTSRLTRATGFGASIELADGDVVLTQRRCWVWMRHLDGSVLLSIDLARLPSDGFAELTRPFTEVRYGSERLAMNRPEYRLSPVGDGDDLLLVDAYTGGLFRIDPLGRATLISSLIGMPKALSPAVAMPDPNRGRLLLFAGEDQTIEPKVESRIDAPPLDTVFPAFLIFEPGSPITAIPHRRLTARPGMPLYALRIDSIAAEPSGTYLAFDIANGELLRARLHN